MKSKSDFIELMNHMNKRCIVNADHYMKADEDRRQYWSGCLDESRHAYAVLSTFYDRNFREVHDERVD